MHKYYNISGILVPKLEDRFKWEGCLEQTFLLQQYQSYNILHVAEFLEVYIVSIVKSFSKSFGPGNTFNNQNTFFNFVLCKA